MTDGGNQFQELISKGHSAAWDQDWGKAASFYRRALEKQPDNTKAMTSLALALFELGQYDQSREFYQQAAENDPEDPIPVEKMVLIHKKMGEKDKASKLALKAAELYLKREDVQKAIDNWKRALEIDPLNVRAHARLAMVYQRVGWKNKSVTEYINVASILHSSGKTRKALESIERALEVMPENIHAMRARDMVRRGKTLPLPVKPRETREEEEPQPKAPQLEAPEEEEPEGQANPVEEACTKALKILAELVFEESLVETSPYARRRDIDDLIDGDGSGSGLSGDDSMLKLHVSHAIELQTEDRKGEAADELKKAVDVGFEHPAAFYNLGYLYYETGRLESALRHLRRSVANPEFSLGSRLLLAKIKEEKELWSEASKEYLEALRIADTRLAPAEERDDLLQLYEAMIDDLEHKEDQDSHQDMSQHISSLLLRKDWRRVLKEHRKRSKAEQDLLPVVDELVESRRNKVISAHRKVKELSNHGYYGAAMEVAFLALREAPTFLPLHITIGDLLLEQGSQSAAIKKYLAVADVYKVQDKLERALALFKKITNLAPLNIEVRERHIALLEEFGQKDQAIKEYINLADVYYSLAELVSARETYERALKLISSVSFGDEWEKKVLHRMADIDSQRLDWDSALDVYKRLRDEYPDDEEISRSIVELYYRLGEERMAGHEMDRYLERFDPEQQSSDILNYLENIKEDNPKEAGIRRKIADFYQSRGEKAYAISELDALGDMLLDEGDTLGAIRIIEEIISLGPSNVEEYKRLLEQLRS